MRPITEIPSNVTYSSSITTTKENFYTPLILGIIVSIGFILWRFNTVLVWNDTTIVSPTINNIPLSIAHIIYLLKGSFGVFSGGYRPLSSFLAVLGLSIVTPYQPIPWSWLLFIGGIYGALAGTYYCVAKKFLQNSWSAIFAVFLVLFSAPVISASWVVLAGIQPIVSLVICIGLLLYWKLIAAKTLSSKIFYTSLLCTTLLVGPWFREFTGILPLLIIFSEINRTYRFTWISFLAAVFFLHSLFPTAIPILFGEHSLPLTTVFSYGDLGGQLTRSGGLLAISFRNLHWNVSTAFLPLFPPLLFVLAFISYAFDSINQRQLNTESKLIPKFIFYTFVFYSILLLYATHRSPGVILPLLLCLGLALIPLRKNPFLSFWFLFSFLPFLKVYAEIVHLAYVMLPAAIILVAAVQTLWNKLRISNTRLQRLFKYSIAIILAIVIMDQAAVAYGSYRVINSTYDGIQKVGLWFEKNIPSNSMVVGNVIHAEDIQLYSKNYFKPYTTVAAGWGRPPETILQDPITFSRFLQKNYGKKPIYLLDVDFNYLPDQASGHRNQYIHFYKVPVRDLGIIHETKVYFPYFDPLKRFIAREHIPFLGAPDLAQDFYNGPAENGKPFLYEVSAKYHLYKVVGTTVIPKPATQAQLINNSIQLVEANYKTFNIAYSSVSKKYYGLAQSEGAFDVQKLMNKTCKHCVQGNSKAQVKRKINQLLASHQNSIGG